jgi:nickel superoxide dismutase
MSVLDNLEATPMKRLFFLFTVTLLIPSSFVSAHCEVPCGIYADQRRFEEMLEDQATIAKAVASMEEISTRLASEPTVQDMNQIARWTTTKETHATNTQHIIAQYFMTQRIKPGGDNVKNLVAAHAVMVAAMKCKQTADQATADALRKTILDFYRAYEGKEPNFESQ